MLHALEIVRSGMPSARHSVYLNAGTFGPLPTRAADAMRARIGSVESRGRIGTNAFAEFTGIRDAARAALAESVSHPSASPSRTRRAAASTSCSEA